MTEYKKFNGWTNYETWLCNLWFDDFWSDSAQEIYNEAEADKYNTKLEAATNDLADRIKSKIEDGDLIEIPSNGFVADLVNATLSEINYYEIAEAYMSEIDTSEESEEDKKEG